MKKIFFITPIGSENSKERTESDFVLESFISPVADKLGYSVLRADLINSSNRIDDDVINQINISDLVIIDITGLNPNVMFEFGIRYGLGKPFVAISQTHDDIPLDIRNIRILEYTVNAPKISRIQEKLSAMIEETSKSNNTNRNAEQIGQNMAIEALQSGDTSKIENFMKLADMMGIDVKDN
ncbi:hypothetical protein [Companilactobacillus metriopterae]|uniref:hypothetical protein n=1 Tax=Companilactobacillus metriopterae TaxID=1909267 RepID=UPI00100A513C|nr:hypothetical protein [Companilactobacillus metriopterae]